MSGPGLVDVHPAWLPPEAFRAVGSRRALLDEQVRCAEEWRDQVNA
ncbi:hypothetical protein [Micromonospora chersina]